MKALILKIGAFLFMAFAFWKWGQVSAKIKTAEDRADEAVKTSNSFEENNSMPFVDNPASFLSYDESEYPTLPEDDKNTGK